MPRSYKILNYRVLILVLTVFSVFSVFGIHPPKYLCKGNGLIYYASPKPPTVDSPDLADWRFQGGSIASSDKRTTAPVFYDTAGTYFTFVKTTYLTPFQEFYDTFIVVVIDWPFCPVLQL